MFSMLWKGGVAISHNLYRIHQLRVETSPSDLLDIKVYSEMRMNSLELITLNILFFKSIPKRRKLIYLLMRFSNKKCGHESVFFFVISD